MLQISAENRMSAGVPAGDEVAVPPDFADALDGDADARYFFDELSYSNKRCYVFLIEDAKTA